MEEKKLTYKDAGVDTKDCLLYTSRHQCEDTLKRMCGKYDRKS